MVRNEVLRYLTMRRDQLFEEANVCEARAHLALADSKDSIYIPDRYFGVKALESYPRILERTPHFGKEQFLKQMKDKLDRIHSLDPPIKSSIPSFLFDALASSESTRGIASALRELRYSDAARYYRELARTGINITLTVKERLKALNEIEEMADSAFKQEGLEPRVTRSFKFTVALTSAAVAYFFPGAAPVAAGTPLLIEAAEQLDHWIRQRTNIFQHYPVASYENLFQELKRLFPGIRFKQEHLAHFLQNRNFGWSKDIPFA